MALMNVDAGLFSLILHIHYLTSMTNDLAEQRYPALRVMTFTIFVKIPYSLSLRTQFVC